MGTHGDRFVTANKISDLGQFMNFLSLYQFNGRIDLNLSPHDEVGR